MSFKSNVYITKEENWYVANSIETGVASQGKTIEEALDNLKEALYLYFDDNDRAIETAMPTLLTSLEVSI